ncbi:hypothetical protein PSTG_19991, partial [Puccinia striiformis f. sp. tritici PST-78]
THTPSSHNLACSSGFLSSSGAVVGMHDAGCTAAMISGSLFPSFGRDCNVRSSSTVLDAPVSVNSLRPLPPFPPSPAAASIANKPRPSEGAVRMREMARRCQ